MKNYNIAVVGATGLVGRTFLQVLEEYDFPVKSIKMLASERSAGSKILFCGKEKFFDVFNTNFFSPVELLRLLAKKKKIVKHQKVIVKDTINY